MAEPVILSAVSPMGAAQIRERLAALLGLSALTEAMAVDLLDEAYKGHKTSLRRHHGVSLEILEPSAPEFLERVDMDSLRPVERDRVKAMLLPACRLVRDVGLGCAVVMLWQGDGLRVYSIEDIGCRCKCTGMAEAA